MTPSGPERSTEEGAPELVPGTARNVTRRGLIGIFGVTGATATLGVAGYAAVAQLTKPTPLPAPHSGQKSADQGTASVISDAALLKAWTKTGRALTTGFSVEGDPGITAGSGPANLSITGGVGAPLIKKLDAAHPGPWPSYPRSQVMRSTPPAAMETSLRNYAPHDPLVLAQADRVLTRLASGTLRMHWQEQGFVSTGARRDGRTGDNLMGPLDGTNNLTTSQLAMTGPIRVSEGDPA